MMIDNANVKYVSGARADYLMFPALEKYPELGAAFAVRGTKGYHYEPISEEANYAGIAAELGVPIDSLTMPFQSHTANVAECREDAKEYKDTDGLVTDLRNRVLCTKVADCISLLFYDPINHAIGNIHSGWRGTLQKIATNGLRKMIELYGTDASELVCVICPSIRQDHFEIDKDVHELFKEAYPQIINEITLQKGTKYHVDTVRCNTWLLEQEGVKTENIIDTGLCTVCHSDLINSFRGNIEGEKQFRNLAMIWLKDK
jgi:YfiH family protein